MCMQYPGPVVHVELRACQVVVAVGGATRHACCHALLRPPRNSDVGGDGAPTNEEVLADAARRMADYKEHVRAIIAENDAETLTAKLVRQKLEERLELPEGELTASKEKKKEISVLIDEVLAENEARSLPPAAPPRTAALPPLLLRAAAGCRAPPWSLPTHCPRAAARNALCVVDTAG